MGVLRGQLTESANYLGILDKKQCGVVKCRGREKYGEKLALGDGRLPSVIYTCLG